MSKGFKACLSLIERLTGICNLHYCVHTTYDGKWYKINRHKNSAFDASFIYAYLVYTHSENMIVRMYLTLLLKHFHCTVSYAIFFLAWMEEARALTMCYACVCVYQLLLHSYPHCVDIIRSFFRVMTNHSASHTFRTATKTVWRSLRFVHALKGDNMTQFPFVYRSNSNCRYWMSSGAATTVYI